MHSKSIHTLELPKILARLAEQTTFSAGRELALALQPSNDAAVVTRALQETREALHLINARASIQLGGAHDVRPFVSNARIGALLHPTDLLDIRDTLARSRALRRTLLRLAAEVPRLAEIAARLMDESQAADEISRCINDRAEVVDSASATLQKIRRELNVARARLMDRLQKMIGSAEFGKYLQEPIITQRSSRYVIPLKADFKGRLPGIVHDQSASGATLFVEPLATVELNNSLRELELQEQKEIERILIELTGLVADEAERIVWTVESLADLDLAFAKAKYAEVLRAREPIIQSSKLEEITGDQGDKADKARVTLSPSSPLSPLILINARHPLLNPETVVPISLQLGGDVRILVITGPNTGGKTVTLKSVGLLALMAQSGLFIPADDGSTLPIFDDVFADIGDEQSIEQSLSTFSSHMRNVIEFLRSAAPTPPPPLHTHSLRSERQVGGGGSLVLLDELGAGTDPVEGSALAQAILEHLRERNVMALVATHYTELKLYAHSTPGVQNASVEFDLETLMPTYHLTVGLPGRSNALAIATRLGLDPQIVEAARARISGEHLQADELLADLKHARQSAEANQQAALQARAAVERLERELRERLHRAEEEKRLLLNEARRTAEQEIEQVRAELAQVRRRLQAAAREAELAEAKNKLDELAKQVEPIQAAPVIATRRSTEPLSVGDPVWIPSLSQRGEVIALNDAEAEVQVGNLRLRLRTVQLEKETRAEAASRVRERGVRLVGGTEEMPSEIHLRGMRADDALITLEKFLDDAYLAGLARVRVVHGKGTGTLRRAVREMLEGHPLVASFRAGDQYEGEEGVTIVALVGS